MIVSLSPSPFPAKLESSHSPFEEEEGSEGREDKNHLLSVLVQSRTDRSEQRSRGKGSALSLTRTRRKKRGEGSRSGGGGKEGGRSRLSSRFAIRFSGHISVAGGLGVESSVEIEVLGFDRHGWRKES